MRLQAGWRRQGAPAERSAVVRCARPEEDHLKLLLSNRIAWLVLRGCSVHRAVIRSINDSVQISLREPPDSK